MKYRCVFKFKSSLMSVEGDLMTNFTSGFWLNSDMNLTRDGDAIYWIPPYQIVYILKVHK